MFEEFSYIGYTALFGLPPLILMWLRREFFNVLAPRLRIILLSSLILTVYGSIIWSVALHHGVWAYGPDTITKIMLFGYVHLDDVVWWLIISLLFSSAVTLGVHYERQGVDIFQRELRGLFQSFVNAFRGFRIITMERNSTIHVAVAVFVLLEAILFRVSKVEWLLVSIAIAMVIALEIVNSAIERISDRIEARVDLDIALIKDASAAGVLVSVLAAAIIGVSIFLTRILAELT